MGESSETVVYVLAALLLVAGTAAAGAVGYVRGASRGSDRVSVFSDRLDAIESNEVQRNSAVNTSLEQLNDAWDRSERKRASAAAAASRLEAAGGEMPPEAAENEPDAVKRARLATQVGGLHRIGR